MDLNISCNIVKDKGFSIWKFNFNQIVPKIKKLEQNIKKRIVLNIPLVHTEGSKSNASCCARYAGYMYVTHIVRISRVTFVWHMRQIHAGCARHIRKSDANVARTCRARNKGCYFWTKTLLAKTWHYKQREHLFHIDWLIRRRVGVYR
jgi:hypothetical protein